MKSFVDQAADLGLNLEQMTDREYILVIEKMNQPSENTIWTGAIPFDKPKLCSKVVPRNIPFRNEIIKLMRRFIPYFKQDPRSHTSFTMLLPAKRRQEAVILQITRKNNTSGYVIIHRNPPQATIQRHIKEKRVLR